MNLAEVLDNLEEDDVRDSYIQPPQDVTEMTEDEEDENCNVFSHQMLTLPAEVKASRKEKIEYNICKRSSKRVIVKPVIVKKNYQKKGQPNSFM